MDAPVVGETLAFEGWRFCMRAGDLVREGPDGGWVPVSIGTRARDILALLLQRPGVLVSKDAIMDAAWPNLVVEPNNLTVQIAALRRILDEGRADGSCIETVPGRGYRFIPRVTRLADRLCDAAQAPAAEVLPLPALVQKPPRRFQPWRLSAGCARSALQRCWRLWRGPAAGLLASRLRLGCLWWCCRSRTWATPRMATWRMGSPTI
jgi:DNA-binding winged helix-turn-helix (wHTH) protein